MKFCLHLTVLTNLLVVIKCVIVVNECNFKKYSDGCEDSLGSFCNKSVNECQCKTGFTIQVQSFCLPPKNFSDPCFVSAQCHSSDIPNVGCFVDDKELDNRSFKLWQSTDNLFKIIGICLCPTTHYLSSNSSKECLLKKQVNEDCGASHECIQLNSYCDQSVKQCKCKPTFRYSIRKRRCVSQLIGENCVDSDQCQVHDSNAECRIGSCQCRTGYMLSHSGRCVIVRLRGTSNHLLMMLVVVATAVIFALLSTAHRKWSSTDDLFRTGRSRNQLPMNTNWITRRTFPTPHNMVFPNSSVSRNQTYPVSLTVPSLALIWPLRQNESDINHRIYLEDGPPSYDEAISQSLRSSDNNNSLTVVTNDSNETNCVNVNTTQHNNTILSNHTNNEDNINVNSNVINNSSNNQNSSISSSNQTNG